MSIKSSLIIILAVFIIYCSVIGFFLYQGSVTRENELADINQAQEISKSAVMIHRLAHSYFYEQAETKDELINKIESTKNYVAGLQAKGGDVQSKTILAQIDLTLTGLERIIITNEEIETIKNNQKDIQFAEGVSALLLDSTRLIDISSTQLKQEEVKNDRIILLMIIIALTIIALVIFIVGFVNISRLNRLKDAARQIYQKKGDVKIDPRLKRSKDEIGDLARAMGEMTTKLKIANATLEAKVKQRTKMLDDKVKEVTDTQEAVMNVAEDLERERRKLKEARAKDAAIISSIGEGVAVSDTKGEILLVNQAFKQLLGAKGGGFAGKDYKKIIRTNEKGENIDFRKEVLTPTLQGKTIVATDLPIKQERKNVYLPSFYYQRSDGTRFPGSTIVTPIQVGKKVIGAVEVFHNILVEKEVDRAKTEFVSLASHQLRTPLSGINWLAEMVLKGDFGHFSSRQKKPLQEIYNSNRKLISLVNSLLNISRIELGTFAITPAPIDVAERCRDVIRQYQKEISKKGLTVVKDIAKNIPKLKLDPQLFDIIIDNLISNAVRYTKPEGKIKISLTKRSKNLVITVADNGIGIPVRQQDKIFTKLFRVDNAQIMDPSGVGLGLYIVRSILQKTGGEIWFESAENKGTTFYVSIPLTGMQKSKGSKKLI